ncbi:MAG TPA: ATP-dependent metalloprotease, partial [Gammaproteobacteria bacterium]
EWCNSAIAVAFGGRIAEELIFGKDKVSTGAQNDIKGATSLARDMIMKWGFSQKLGPILYSEDEDEVFLGRSVTQHKNVSDETAHAIDMEVRRVIDDNYKLAERILKDHIDKLHLMADALIKYETIDSGQVAAIMEGREPGPPADWGEDKPTAGSGGTRKKPSEEPGEGSIGGPASLH